MIYIIYVCAYPKYDERLQHLEVSGPGFHVRPTKIFDVIGLHGDEVGCRGHQEVEHLARKRQIRDFQSLEMLEVTSFGKPLAPERGLARILLLDDQGHEVGAVLDDLREVHVFTLHLETFELGPDDLEAMVHIFHLEKEENGKKSLNVSS